MFPIRIAFALLLRFISSTMLVAFHRAEFWCSS
jgi:hypothetical protein